MSSQADVARAAQALERGELVCFPTETFYGLAARIDRPAALARLVALKGRDARAPFGLIAGDAEVARALASAWPEVAAELAAAHWPGPLTLVVPARTELPAEVIGPGGGVGVRVSSHPIAAALATAAGVAITATSANPSGEPPARTVAQARAYFGEGVAVYIDGGEADATHASTVASVSGEGAVKVLRPGAVVVQERQPEEIHG
jgi:L-threonylcarbamoyladenylate synthase